MCRLRWCNTDLGANVLSWPRLIQENKRFSQLAPVACGLPAENYDGVLAQHLVDCNWTVHHVTDKCLYDHSPSPQVRSPLAVQGSSCCQLMCVASRHTYCACKYFVANAFALILQHFQPRLTQHCRPPACHMQIMQETGTCSIIQLSPFRHVASLALVHEAVCSVSIVSVACNHTFSTICGSQLIHVLRALTQGVTHMTNM